MKKIIFLITLALPLFCTAQKRDNVWCFGDSAGIDFNSGVAVPITSSVNSSGSCASVSDTAGNLLFYVAYDPTALISGTDPLKAYNSNGLVMLNGDSMKGSAWYNE